MLNIQCQCGEVFHADDSQVGRSIRCSTCGNVLLITAPLKPKVNVVSSGSKEIKISEKYQQQIQRVLKGYSKIRISIILGVLGIIFLFVILFKPFSGNETLKNDEHSSAILPEQVYAPSTEAVSIPVKSFTHPNRPRTGCRPYVWSINKSGHSKITIHNGTDTDAYVIVTNRKDGVELGIRNFYIRAHDVFSESHIPPGDYVLYVAFGRIWDQVSKEFNDPDTLFTKTQSFMIEESTWSENQEDNRVLRTTKSSNISITLHKVIGGNFKSHPISKAEFFNSTNSSSIPGKQ